VRDTVQTRSELQSDGAPAKSYLADAETEITAQNLQRPFRECEWPPLAQPCHAGGSCQTHHGNGAAWRGSGRSGSTISGSTTYLPLPTVDRRKSKPRSPLSWLQCVLSRFWRPWQASPVLQWPQAHAIGLIPATPRRSPACRRDFRTGRVGMAGAS
jgi:hypothetical protein